MPLRSWLFGALLAGAFPCLASGLPPRVRAGMEAAGIPLDAIGIVVQDVSGAAPLLAHHPERSMQPASTLKLLTSLVVLETLGPDYRGSAQLLTEGDVDEGVLRGDLVLRGRGDVDLDWPAFERMLLRLRSQGIRRIRGDLVLDLTMFSPARIDIGAPPFDESPEFRYNVIPDALLLNTNLLQLDLSSDQRDLRVTLATPMEAVAIDSELALVDRACEDWEDGWVTPEVRAGRRGALRIVLKGEYPRGCDASTAINVIDRVAFADRLFRALWKRSGGSFHGVTRQGAAGSGSRELAEHKSRSLAEMVRDINKRSDNPITRVLYLTLGARSGIAGDEPTAARSHREVMAWLERRAIPSAGLVLENGSGLSRSERITPLQLAAILRAGKASPWAPEFLASLPIVSMDGGMRRRLHGTLASGRARIKSGTLRDVSAIAGFVDNELGETFVVAAMINHPLAIARVARPILDELIDWVATCAGRPRGCEGSPP